MGFIMAICAVASLAFGIYVAATSTVTDIQLGIVVTALVGGAGLLGLGAVLGGIGDILRRLNRQDAVLKKLEAELSARR